MLGTSFPAAVMTDSTTLSTLEQHARETRNIFLRVLGGSLGSVDTRGTCAYAAVLLATTLTKFCGVRAFVQGGDGFNDGAYVDKEGHRRGHYWVCAVHSPLDGFGWVIDITADQFGDEPVIVLPIHKAVARYQAGDQEATVDEGIASLVARSRPDREPTEILSAQRFVAKSGGANQVGKIFIDYLRNGRSQTTAAAYSARAIPGLGVSMPVDWEQLFDLKSGAHWTIRTAIEHVESRASVPRVAYPECKQILSKAIKLLGLD